MATCGVTTSPLAMVGDEVVASEIPKVIEHDVTAWQQSRVAGTSHGLSCCAGVDF